MLKETPFQHMYRTIHVVLLGRTLGYTAWIFDVKASSVRRSIFKVLRHDEGWRKVMRESEQHFPAIELGKIRKLDGKDKLKLVINACKNYMDKVGE